MSSSIKLKNANGKTVSVTNSNANQTDKEIIYLNTVDELANASGSINAVAIVSDLSRGGTFIWSSTGTANGGTVFAGVSGYWNRQYSGAVNVKWFGAKGDGVTDDTVAIQNALDSLAVNGSATGDNSYSSFAINSRLNISNKKLICINIKYTGNNGLIVVGGKSTLKDITFTIGTTIRSFNQPLAGVINLHLATNVTIDNIEILDGISDRIGIFCSTSASNTVIKNCKMNYIGWPILFNDAVPAQRIVDSIDYAGLSIGSGLFISNCELGAADKTSVGDSIEINCLSARFSNIKVNNNISLKTNLSGVANGLGFGFANIDTLNITNNLICGCVSYAGAIHIERTNNAVIEGNTLHNCTNAIGCGVDGSNTLINGNSISHCTEGISIIGSSSTYYGIVISNNNINYTNTYPLVLLNCSAVSIISNIISNTRTTGKPYVSIQQSGALYAESISIAHNIFIVKNGIDNVILSTTGTVKEVETIGNKFIGDFSANSKTGYFVAVKAVGVCKEHFNNTGTTSALCITTSGTPQGYVTGHIGDIATDVNNGKIYIHDGTNWVAKVQ